MVDHALRAAEGARSEEKLRVLARVAAAGSHPGASAAQVDRAHFLLDLIAQLEAPHIAVLRCVAMPTGGRFGIYGGWTAAGVAAELPQLGDLGPAVLMTLVGLGLVANCQAGAAITPESWVLTQPGAWVLEQLQERANGELI